MKIEKKYLILTIVFIIIISIIVFFVFNNKIKLSYENTYIKTFSNNDKDPGIDDEYNWALNKEVSDIHLLSKSKFDFSNMSDYSQITFEYYLRNLSLSTINNIEYEIKKINKFKQKFVYKQDQVVNKEAKPFEKVYLRFDFIIKTKNMNDSKIKEAIEGLDLELKYNVGSSIKKEDIILPKDFNLQKL